MPIGSPKYNSCFPEGTFPNPVEGANLQMHLPVPKQEQKPSAQSTRSNRQNTFLQFIQSCIVLIYKKPRRSAPFIPGRKDNLAQDSRKALETAGTNACLLYFSKNNKQLKLSSSCSFAEKSQ